MKMIKNYKGNALIKLGIAFFVVLAIVACQESKMKKEGEVAVNAFLKEMNPELEKKITKIEEEISLTKKKITQLSELKLKHPNYANTIETSRREWVHLQNKLKDTLKEIWDTVESTYVAYELDKIQGGRQLDKISDKLLSSANAVLISANTAKNVIDQTLYDLEEQSLDSEEQPVDNVASRQESRSSLSTNTQERVYPENDVSETKEQQPQKEEPQTINSFWEDLSPVTPTNPKQTNLSTTGLPTRLYKVLNGHTGDVNAVAFSPDGRIIASGSSDTTVKLWEVNSGKEIKTLQDARGDVLTVAFNTQSEYLLASGGSDRTIKLWDINTKEKPRTLLGHEGAIHSVVFSPDGQTLASGSWDKTIRLWDINSAKELRVINGEDSIYSVAFSPNGQFIAAGSFNETITVWEIETGDLLYTLKEHGMRTVYSVAFSPDGRIMTSGDLSNNVRIWNTNSGDSKLTLKGSENLFAGIFSVAFRSDGQVIASGSGDGTLKFWDANSGEELHTHRFKENEVRSVAFSSDGHKLASGHDDNTIKLWKVP